LLFTALAIGLMIQDKTPSRPAVGERTSSILDWSTRIKDILPDFQMTDKTTESEVTIEDLLSESTVLSFMSVED